MNSEKNVGECPCGSGWTWLDPSEVQFVPQVFPYPPVVSYSSNAIDLLPYPLVGGLALDHFNDMYHLNCFSTYPWL